MYMEFTYDIPYQLVPLVSEQIRGFSNTNMVGWLESNDARKMRHRAMYIVCEYEGNTKDHNGGTFTSPILMVAATESDAVSMYKNITGRDSGSVLCEVHHSCDKITAKPTGRTMDSSKYVRNEIPI